MSLDRLNSMSDVEALARIIEAEAAAEPFEGKVAVGAVIDNRRRDGRYGEGWKGVIAKPGQFSAINDVTGYAGGKGANKIFWRQPSEDSIRVAQAVVGGQYKDPTGGATHYFNPSIVNPKWARGKEFSPIGAHVFGQADAGRAVSGGNGQDQLRGGPGRDELIQEAVRRGLISKSEIEAEASRRGLLGDQAQAVAAEGPSEQDRTDVEAALGQLNSPPAQEPAPPAQNPAKNRMTGGDILLRALGLDPSTLPPEVKEAGDLIFQGQTAEFGDEIMAGGNVLAQRLSGKDATFGEEVAIQRENMDAVEGKSTAANILGKGAGALMSGAAAGAALPAATTVPGKVAVGAAEGAVFGGLTAAGAADGEDRLEAGAEGAVGGALVGGALARAGASFGRYLNMRAAAKSAPSGADLKNASQQLFDAARKSGIVYRPQPVKEMVSGVAARLLDDGIDAQIHPKASRVMSRLLDLVEKPATLKEVERFRKLATDAAFEAKPGSADQRLALMIRETLDEFSLDQSNMVAASAGAELQREARRLWSQFRKDELVTEQVAKAVRRAESTGSGGNVNNAIRQNLRRILDNKKMRSGFTPEEIAAIENIVSGGPVDGFLRLAGKLSPSGNGLMLGMNLGAAGATGGASLAITGVAAGAKELADRATTQRVKTLAAIIRSGGRPAQSRINALSKIEKKALRNLIAGQSGEAVGEPIADQFRKLEATGK